MEFPAPAATTLLNLKLTTPQWNLVNCYGRFCYSILLIFFLFMQPTTAQPQNPPPPPQYQLQSFKIDKTMGILLLILIVLFFLLGCFCIYTRQCAERRIRRRLGFAFPIPVSDGGIRRRQRGLDRAVVDTFPTFVYSAVKDLKIGRSVLECAVCLNEFRDDETLRLIPKCSHVFHPDCIDVWLADHSTCPVCRANIVPKPDDVAIEIPGPGTSESEQPGPIDPNVVECNDRNRGITTESPRQNLDERVQNSPGLGIPGLFSRSHSTGHSLVGPGEDCERFTLRLPEDVRHGLVNRSELKRTTSCGMTFQLESSGRRDYRTQSVGRNEGFGRDGRFEWWGFKWTPPFVITTGPSSSTKLSSGVRDEVGVGERSFDCLNPNDKGVSVRVYFGYDEEIIE